MHLLSEESFHRIAQLWGSLIKLETATVEPHSFERTRFLIETPCLERVGETIDLVMGDWFGRIRVVPVVSEPGVEVIVAEGVARKVRSVNDLILSMGSEEQQSAIAKARAKGHRNKVRPGLGDDCEGLGGAAKRRRGVGYAL
ncbi:hypothetical protein V6N13_099660 [Hibiscus sabdariffa]